MGRNWEILVNPRIRFLYIIELIFDEFWHFNLCHNIYFQFRGNFAVSLSSSKSSHVLTIKNIFFDAKVGFKFSFPFQHNFSRFKAFFKKLKRCSVKSRNLMIYLWPPSGRNRPKLRNFCKPQNLFFIPYWAYFRRILTF